MGTFGCSRGSSQNNAPDVQDTAVLPLEDTTVDTPSSLDLSTDHITDQEEGTYNPDISPDDFVSGVTNPFFPPGPGMKWLCEAQRDEGLEQIIIAVQG